MRNDAHATTPERLALSAADLARALNCSSRYIWKMLATGRLPKPIRLGRSARRLRADGLTHLETMER